MSEWMLYAAVLGLLISGIAEAVHRLLLARGISLRWVWLVAFVVSVMLPLVPTIRYASATRMQPVAEVAPTLEVESGTLSEPMNPPLDIEGTLLLAWLAWTAALVLSALISVARVRRLRRAWQRATIANERVLLSRDTGPAVVGVWSPEIVVPEWLLALPPDAQEMVLAHERAHIRARDPLLLAATQAVVAAFPWNIALWYQRRRLRESIELDCDLRTTRGGHASVSYAQLLLTVGQRVTRAAIPVAAMAEPRSLLEKRVERLLAPRRLSRAQAAACLLLAVLCTVGATQTPRRGPAFVISYGESAAQAVPAAPATQPIPFIPVMGPLSNAVKAAPVRRAAQDTLRKLPVAPFMTAYTQPPELLNAGEVVRAARELYPEELRASGATGVTHIRISVDKSGEVTARKVRRRSGHDSFDVAAAKAANQARFKPTMNRGEPIESSFELPISFSGGEATLLPVAAVFTAPDTALVRRTIEKHFPRLENVGTQTVLWFLSSATGEVLRTALSDRTGASVQSTRQSLLAGYQNTDVGWTLQMRNPSGGQITWLSLKR